MNIKINVDKGIAHFHSFHKRQGLKHHIVNTTFVRGVAYSLNSHSIRIETHIPTYSTLRYRSLIHQLHTQQGLKLFVEGCELEIGDPLFTDSILNKD